MAKNPSSQVAPRTGALGAQLAEQRMPMAEWVMHCSQGLRTRLPEWPVRELEARAAMLWVCADCMPPDEAAEIVAAWWRARA